MKVEISDETLKKVSKETLVKAWERANKPEPKPEYVPEHGDFGVSKYNSHCGAINLSSEGMKNVGDGCLLYDFRKDSNYHVHTKYFNAFELLEQIKEAMGKKENIIEDDDGDILKIDRGVNYIWLRKDNLLSFAPDQARQVAAALIAKAIEVENEQSDC